MSFAQRATSTKVSPEDIASLKVDADALPFVSEQGVRIDKSNPVAKLEAVAAAASEPTLRQQGTGHLAARRPEDIANAKRALRPLANMVEQLAGFAERRGTAPNKADAQKAFATARALFNERDDLGARAQQILDSAASQLALGDIKTVGRRR